MTFETAPTPVIVGQRLRTSSAVGCNDPPYVPRVARGITVGDVCVVVGRGFDATGADVVVSEVGVAGLRRCHCC